MMNGFVGGRVLGKEWEKEVARWFSPPPPNRPTFPDPFISEM